MIGAITGDVVGSRFEFDNYRAKDFEFFSKRCFFTDDTVMTLAIARTFLSCRDTEDIDDFKKKLILNMHEVGRKYPGCGYGTKFYNWVMQKRTEPYNSYGNGSAMRVSSVGWFATSLEECERLAAATAEVSHNHPEGIKGAVSVAGAVYLAKTGHSMQEIKEYVSKYYVIDFTIDEIRDSYCFNETCQETVPQALEAFFESTDFEDAVRIAISVGGDSDTLAAITGSVADAYYGVSNEIKDMTLSYLDDYLLDIAKEFIDRFVCR